MTSAALPARRHAALAVAVLAVAVAVAPPSWATGGHPGAAYCQVAPLSSTTGPVVDVQPSRISYWPPLDTSPVAAERSVTMDLRPACDGAMSPPGTWVLRVEGNEIGNVAQGQTVGRLTVTGRDPSGRPIAEGAGGWLRVDSTITGDLYVVMEQTGQTVAMGLTARMVGAQLAGEVTMQANGAQHYVGRPCALVSVGGQDQGPRVGEVHAAWQVTAADTVDVSCYVSVGDAVISADDTSAGQSSTGPVVVLVAPVTFEAGPGVPVWVCTELSWTYHPDLFGPGGGRWPGETNPRDGSRFCDPMTLPAVT